MNISNRCFVASAIVAILSILVAAGAYGQGSVVKAGTLVPVARLYPKTNVWPSLR
jgi:hypothetical protein